MNGEKRTKQSTLTASRSDRTKWRQTGEIGSRVFSARRLRSRAYPACHHGGRSMGFNLPSRFVCNASRDMLPASVLLSSHAPAAGRGFTSCMQPALHMPPPTRHRCNRAVYRSRLSPSAIATAKCVQLITEFIDSGTMSVCPHIPVLDMIYNRHI